MTGVKKGSGPWLSRLTHKMRCDGRHACSCHMMTLLPFLPCHDVELLRLQKFPSHENDNNDDVRASLSDIQNMFKYLA